MPHPETDTPLHGGDLDFATLRYGRPLDGWLDLSTGINPNPWSGSGDLPLADVTRLPSLAALAGLLDAARDAYGVPSGVALAAVPGTEIAIRMLPFGAVPGPVALVTPTYGSHLAALGYAGRKIVTIGSIADVPDDATLVILGNPNNPNGRTTSPGELVALARRLGKGGGFLVVDEAFADVAPSLSLAPHLDGLPAIVLRSFGKFYGLAGIRLGFVAGHAPVAEHLETMLGAWPVSASAIAVGTAALRDTGWRDATRINLHAAAGRLSAMLTANGFRVAGGTDLFVFAEHRNARRVHETLAGLGIWTRAFTELPHHLRFGIPPDGAFPRLDAALAAIR